MAQIFQEVQLEMTRSLSMLKPTHDFTIIYFANNKYIEGPKRGTVSGNMENKIAAAKFLKKIAPGGSRYTGADGKTLTGNEAVIQWLRENNRKEEEKGLVHVNTFLFGNPEEEAKKAMETIAKENGGRFGLISTDE